MIVNQKLSDSLIRIIVLGIIGFKYFKLLKVL